MAKNKTEESNQGFQKKGKKLIICMIAALFICPIICDHNDVLWLVSGAGKVSLPSYSSWKKGVYGQDDKVYLFSTYGGHHSGTLTVTFADMPVKFKGNKMYDKAGEYVGKIRKKANGDIVIYASDMPSYDIDGTYKKVK
ncbi:MAG: hypothetical protein IKJ78_06615 [Bacteroidales bacterium]|nr:hypothetical protein [Bacteroidales bacterium]